VSYKGEEMRFKFRAWHSGVGEMIPNCNQGFEGNVFTWVNEGQPIQIMQGLWIADSNGTDIYEGDIVTDHLGIGVVEYSEKYAGFRVNYKDGLCKWFYDYNLRGERESIEVIGNIYENPELATAATK
jgi:uncharacterized phage protein (TIGR01671 family)